MFQASLMHSKVSSIWNTENCRCSISQWEGFSTRNKGDKNKKRGAHSEQLSCSSTGKFNQCPFGDYNIGMPKMLSARKRFLSMCISEMMLYDICISLLQREMKSPKAQKLTDKVEPDM